METSPFNMELKQFKSLFPSENQVGLGDDFCIIDMPYIEREPRFLTPVRLDAYLVVFCIGGKVRLNINMKEFTMEKDQIALIIPGFIAQVINVDPEHIHESHYVTVGMSRRYLSTLHLDMNRFFAEGSALPGSPCVKMTQEEKEIAAQYSRLAGLVLRSELPNKYESVASLISSLFYLTEGVFTRRADSVPSDEPVRPGRAEEVFNKFLRLLAEYHTQERGVAFYAGKLFLSPKYFSKLIKEASGRSAPEWIDSYVIMEAKNYLKYSTMSIKEIVYKLNFADQPTFTKYFKAHTGITPAQFRKG